MPSIGEISGKQTNLMSKKIQKFSVKNPSIFEISEVFSFLSFQEGVSIIRVSVFQLDTFCTQSSVNRL